MEPKQQAALEVLAERTFTTNDLTALVDLVAARNDVAIAAYLSTGRTKHGATAIGPGTIIAVMGDPRGGEFLDAVQVLGETDRTVYWGMDPVRRGALDLSVPAGRKAMGDLKQKMPDYAGDIAKLLLVGVVADPIDYMQVSAKLNEAEGRMTL